MIIPLQEAVLGLGFPAHKFLPLLLPLISAIIDNLYSNMLPRNQVFILIPEKDRSEDANETARNDEVRSQ